MKVGVITFHFAYNYGALLQAYALRTYIGYLGIEANFVNYIPEKFRYEYNIGRGVLYNIRHLKNWKKKRKQRMLFSKFQQESLQVSPGIIRNHDELKKKLEEYDVLIYGSDQIWNGNITKNDPAYFGEFAKIRKLAYAASMGCDRLSQFQKNAIIKYLPHFDAVSVRERQNAESIERILNGTLKVYTVVDPVFLLSKAEWEKIVCKSLVPVNFKKEKYILLYSLTKDDELKLMTEEIAKREMLPVVNIHPNNDYKLECGNIYHACGPNEFLDLLKNAEYVAANSYHALSFSVIFDKKVLLGKMEYSNRVINLLGLFGIRPGTLENNMIIDFSKVNKQEIINQIQNSKDFISKSLMLIGRETECL